MLGLAALAGTGCSRPWSGSRASDADNRPAERHEGGEPAARKVGHAAYGVAQESKKVMKEAGHDLRVAGREMHEGWKDAKRESKSTENDRR